MTWWMKSKTVGGAVLVAAAALVQAIPVVLEAASNIQMVVHDPRLVVALALAGNALAAIGIRAKQERSTPKDK